MGAVAEKRGVGRPKGAQFSIPVRTYENAEGIELLQRLAEDQGTSVAAVVRQLVREEARRRGLLAPKHSRGERMRAAAEQMRDYYENSPEVREWEAGPHAYVKDQS